MEQVGQEDELSQWNEGDNDMADARQVSLTKNESSTNGNWRLALFGHDKKKGLLSEYLLNLLVTIGRWRQILVWEKSHGNPSSDNREMVDVINERLWEIENIGCNRLDLLGMGSMLSLDEMTHGGIIRDKFIEFKS
ncbi:hypothetical protein GOBAR_DD09420 [Gossypium barbadense]|nr:hypothetical protein GOBAR_DD09420 [Gossypium barbadense]